jgi:hypothetical protein
VKQVKQFLVELLVLVSSKVVDRIYRVVASYSTYQYWHQKRSMWASLGRASTVLKHSNAGMA